VPCDILHDWTRWLKELNALSEFKVERCVKPISCGSCIHAQLHHFSDASEQGYGTVTYLRIQNCNNDIHIAFLMGKARVTTLKVITVPRLELTAYMLKKALRLQLQESIFWTDSTSVFKYVMNEDKCFHTFVANRVFIIREGTKTSQWRYQRRIQRMMHPEEGGLEILLRKIKWIEGPNFICKPDEDWPKNLVQTALGVDGLEFNKEAIANVVNTQGALKGIDWLMAYFSYWRKLQVAVG